MIPIVLMIMAGIGENKCPVATSNMIIGNIMVTLFIAYKLMRTNAAINKLSGVYSKIVCTEILSLNPMKHIMNMKHTRSGRYCRKEI